MLRMLRCSYPDPSISGHIILPPCNGTPRVCDNLVEWLMAAILNSGCKLPFVIEGKSYFAEAVNSGVVSLRPTSGGNLLNVPSKDLGLPTEIKLTRKK